MAVERYSERAQKIYGSGRVFVCVCRQQLPFPRDEEGLRSFLLNLSARKGIRLPALFLMSRSQSDGQKRGWVGVGHLLLCDEKSPLVVKKKFSEIPGIPGVDVWEDYYWKRPPEPDRFKLIPNFKAIL